MEAWARGRVAKGFPIQGRGRGPGCRQRPRGCLPPGGSPVAGGRHTATGCRGGILRGPLAPPCSPGGPLAWGDGGRPGPPAPAPSAGAGTRWDARGGMWGAREARTRSRRHYRKGKTRLPVTDSRPGARVPKDALDCLDRRAMQVPLRIAIVNWDWVRLSSHIHMWGSLSPHHWWFGPRAF